MTTFTYDVSKRPDKVKAVLHLFDGGPKLYLAVKADSGKTVWFYDDGSVSVQSGGMDGNGKDIVQRFYEGDSITIKF